MTIYEAINAAKKEFKELEKDGYNPFKKNKYVKLDSILKMIAEPLENNGLMLMQPIEDEKVVTRVILVETGDTCESEIKLNMDANPQEIGAQISYFRRYALSSLFGIISEEDADGNDAGQSKSGGKSKGKDPDKVISGAQVGRLHTLRKGAITESQYRKILKGLKYESTKDITGKDYEEICQLVEAAGKAAKIALEKFGGALTRKQGEAILAVGKAIDLKDKEIREVINWYCRHNEYGGRSSDAGKQLLAHFDDIRKQYKDAQEKSDEKDS